MPIITVANALLVVLFFCLGAVIASFIGVLAERVNTGEGWAKSRSRCNSCNRFLSGLDLVPMLSWLLSRGRCRTCKSRVPWLYTLSEFVLGLVFALSYQQIGLTLSLPVFLLALCVLAFIVLYDLRHTVVPFSSALLLFALTLVYAVLSSHSLIALGANFLVAGVIGLGFFLLYALSRGRAMGLGDAPVALSLSLLASSAAIPGFLFSFWIGAVVGIMILATRPKGSRMGIEVPFVPFLAAGFLLAFFTQWNPLLFTLW